MAAQPQNDSKPVVLPGVRYDPIVRVITAFFAALIGFGIKRLLDLDDSSVPELAPIKIPCFLISVLLFLRYLTGSASHLWLEYVKHDDPKRPWFFAFDIGFLILFGVLALCICYSDDLLDFFCWSATLNLSAVIWGLIREQFHPNDHSNWHPWLWIDGIHSLVFALGSFVRLSSPELAGNFSFGIWAWVIIGIFMFGWDIKIQIRNLEDGGV